MRKILYLIAIFVLLKFHLSFAGRISVFCNLYHNSGINAVMEIKEITIQGERGYQILDLKNSEISTQLPFSQTLIATGIVPSGKYNKIKIVLKKVIFEGKNLKISQKIIELPISFELKKGDSKSLFLNWNVAESFGNVFCPRFYVSLPYKPLPGENLFVFSKDTVWIIDPNLNQVIYSFGITGEPQGVAVDLNNNKIYVVCKKEKVIKVINMNSFQVVEIIPIPLLKIPQFIALGEEGEALITSPEDYMILVMDLSTGGIISQRKLNFMPYEAYYLKSIGKFIVSSYDEGAVYLYDSNLSSETRLTGGFRTEGFVSDGEFLYLTDTQGGVHVYILPQLQYRGKINACDSTLRGISADDKIFITCREGKVILISQGGYVERTIETEGKIFAIVYLPKKKWIYVGFSEEDAIGVIDLVREKFLGKISIGGIPRELASSD
ncbi:YncE family protein [Thermodesulfobacterium hydrogeniphilum]|uniref:YncE family protein n=1 Tax=Thermodesulfobacterium hydrogeniphilum TaxID=161156 RepID=UPI00056F05C5|nr:YncE family protein [Thermodesulfobacterium hydrogeniphilum]